MSAIMDIWHSILGIANSSDWITLAIMAVIIVGAAFAMQGMEALINTTLLALVVFAIAVYIRGVAMGGQNAAKLADANWHGFLTLPMQSLIAYAIPFAVLIAVIHAIRSAVWR